MKILKYWWLLVIFIIVILFFTVALPIGFYLPHKIPVLILPIESKYDSLCGIMPMGEKINHPDAPSGHPGIDLGFGNIDEPIYYIAAMDGIISKVKIYDNKEKASKGSQVISKKEADVVITNGFYQTVYSEMDGESLLPNIKVGMKIKQGEKIGYGNIMMKPTKSQMIHWEFGSITPLIDRFCPLKYFTEESEKRIEQIWNQTDTPEMKARYPEICNGDYNEKYER